MTESSSRSVRLQFVSLLGSRALALVIGLVSSFVFITLMDQETFGAYKYAVNFLNAVTVFALVGLPYTASRLLLKRDAVGSRAVYGYVTRLMVLISLVISVLLVIGGWGLQSAGILTLAPGLLLAVGLLFTVTLQNTFITMLQGSNRINDISLQTLLPPALLLGGALMLSRWQDQLSIHQILGLFGLAYTAVHAFTIIRLRIPVIGSSDTELVRELRAEHRANGWDIYLGSLVGVASGYVINAILGAAGGLAEYALLGLALSLAGPLQFIPAVMGTVQFRANSAADRLSSKNLVLTVGLTIAALVGFVVFLRLVLPLFPDAYQGAYLYSVILAGYFAAMGLGDYFNRFISAHGHGRVINMGAITTGIANIVLSLVALQGWGVTGAVWARFVSGLVYLAYMMLAYRRISASLRSAS